METVPFERFINNKINSLHEKAVRITYNDKSYSFKDLPRKGKSVSVHHRNIQVLATKMFKVKNNIAPGVMKELLRPKMSRYGLRSNNSFERRRGNSGRYDTESVSYLGSKTWDLVPNEIKQSDIFNAFILNHKEGLGQVGFIFT